jgi:hypothetical protein
VPSTERRRHLRRLLKIQKPVVSLPNSAFVFHPGSICVGDDLTCYDAMSSGDTDDRSTGMLFGTPVS